MMKGIGRLRFERPGFDPPGFDHPRWAIRRACPSYFEICNNIVLAADTKQNISMVGPSI